MQQHAILIPTSRFVAEGMRSEVGKIPPVVIPIQGKTLLDLMVKERNRVFPTAPIFLVVNQGKELVWELLSRNAYDNVHTIEVPELPDLGETIEFALGKIKLFKDLQVTINFGDTLVSFETLPTDDTIYYESCRESYLWTSFEQKAGKISKIIDRYGSESLAVSDVFVGAFNIRNPALFLKELRRTKRRHIKDVSKFYSALHGYLSRRDYKIQKAPTWLDFGHVENYHRARRCSSIARSFNSLEFNDYRPTVTKTSSHADKLRNEIKWYLDLPRDFKCYAPQVINYDLKKPAVELEYYGYPTLAELFTTAGHGLEIWWPIIQSINKILQEMRHYSSKTPAPQRREILSEMYIEKTRQRIAELDSHPVLGALANESLSINGKRLPSLKSFTKVLPKICKAAGILHSPGFTLIHGDLCFSNILFDTRMRLAKLIDPRGSFGKPGIYGDPRYDLAKILHSTEGKYDLVKSNQFFAIVEGDSINYSLYTKPIQETAAKFFREVLSGSFKDEFNEASLIESLLFASLISLHNESLHHQIAFLAIALTKLNAQARRLKIRVA